MPNWFIAFVVDGAFVEELPELPMGLRRFHREDTHLTLAFLGRCGEQAAARAWSALDRVEGLRWAPVDISLDGVVAMGNPRHYSALSALLSRGREKVEHWIARTRDELCDAASAARDERSPKPHITIARPKRRATHAQRRAGLRWADAIDLRSITLRLSQIALYTATEDRSERLFRIVEQRSLP